MSASSAGRIRATSRLQGERPLLLSLFSVSEKGGRGWGLGKGKVPFSHTLWLPLPQGAARPGHHPSLPPPTTRSSHLFFPLKTPTSWKRQPFCETLGFWVALFRPKKAPSRKKATYFSYSTLLGCLFSPPKKPFQGNRQPHSVILGF